MSTSTSSLIDRLFGAGAHFGFRKSRRHPTVVPFLFTSKEGNDIFDLEQSAAQLQTATAVLEEAAKNGKVILFVGTKDEVSAVVKHYATLVEVPYVVNRWIGGMMTNFSEIKKRILRLETLIREKESGELDRKYTKKERVLINREVTKLQFNFGGIATITRPVDLMVIVDPRHDSIAMDEAKDLKIPTVAIMSSDCDVSRVTYPVLVNDALQSSVALVLGEFTTAIERGKAAFVPKPVAPRPTSTSGSSTPVRNNRRPRTAA
ncbi:MAG: 30S ribosomal protein S2 [Candidatus Paceibacteria bacterium]